MCSGVYVLPSMYIFTLTIYIVCTRIYLNLCTCMYAVCVSVSMCCFVYMSVHACAHTCVVYQVMQIMTWDECALICLQLHTAFLWLLLWEGGVFAGTVCLLPNFLK